MFVIVLCSFDGTRPLRTTTRNAPQPSRCSPRSPHIFCKREQRVRLGGGRAGPGRRRRLPPASSVLARGLSGDKLWNAVARPTPRFAFDHIASNGVYPGAPASFGVNLTRCSRCEPQQTAQTINTSRAEMYAPIRLSLSGQRSYAYVMRGSQGTRLLTTSSAVNAIVVDLNEILPRKHQPQPPRFCHCNGIDVARARAS